MNYKNKFFIAGLILLILLSVSVVTACENSSETCGIEETPTNNYYENLQSTNSNVNIISNDNSNETLLNVNSDEKTNIAIDEEDNKLSAGSNKNIRYHSSIWIQSIEYNPNQPIKLNVSILISGRSSWSVPYSTLGHVSLFIDDEKLSFDYPITRNYDPEHHSMKDSYEFRTSILITTNKKFDIGSYQLKVQFTPTDTAHYEFASVNKNISIINYAELNVNPIDSSGRKYQIKVVGYDKQPLKDVKLKITLFDSSNNIVSTINTFTNSKGVYEYIISNRNGLYNLCVSLEEKGYSAKPVSINTSVTKSNAIIEVPNFEIAYGNKIPVSVFDLDTYNPLKNVVVKVIFYLSSSKCTTNYYTTNSYGKIYLKNPNTIGTYKIIVSLDDSIYVAEKITSKIKLTKNHVSISAKKITGDTKSYFNLKAIVTDNLGNPVTSGTVKFTINGKSYKANVKNGIATKKLKLKKGTYNYKSVYTSKNYYSASCSSKVVVKQAYDYYTVKIGKYSVKVPYSDYKKIKKKKKSGYFSKKYYTGKTITYKVYKDEKKVSTKKKLYSYGTYTTYYKNNPDALVTPEGYEFAGKEYKTENGVEKVYMVYKKTTYKKTFVANKQAKVYIYIDSTPEWGATAQLYYKESEYQDRYGGVETKYYMGNTKKIF